MVPGIEPGNAEAILQTIQSNKNNLGGNDISVLLGNGDGTFRAAVEYGAGSNPKSVAVGDFNGDNKMDLVVTNNAEGGGTPSVSLLLGKGDGTFQTAVDYRFGVEPEAVAVGDFDRDGKLDVAVADYGNTTVYVLSTSFSFADQLPGSTSPTQPVALTNYGASPLNITSISITGTDAADFLQTNTCGSSVAAGASCSVNVTFTPEEIGRRTATLSIADDAPGSPQTVSLKGAGTGVELVPSSLEFGYVALGGSRTLTITLTNTRSTTLGITGISNSGKGFSQNNDCGATLEAGKSCTIRVTFTPPGPGDFIGAASVSDNGGGSPQQVPLSGYSRFI
jgi:FG-GAP-like repeat/Abnormal spindle-like microcephaly-assoc'd, ASPM-SPD-2-Hydin